MLGGPTGESNRLTFVPRAPLLCLGPSLPAALAQAESVRALGGTAIEAPGLDPAVLTRLTGFSAARSGPILPLIADVPDIGHVMLERHVCIDTTASGGNAQLLAQGAA